jgi:uncharacterized protein
MAEKTKREKEEQYFAELEMKRRKELREKLNQKREEAGKDKSKQPWWRRCPKCGTALVEKKIVDVVVDECPGCKGIYLDAGELELLLEGAGSQGFLSKVTGSIFGKK